jgi:hypothetical protein
VWSLLATLVKRATVAQRGSRELRQYVLTVLDAVLLKHQSSRPAATSSSSSSSAGDGADAATAAAPATRADLQAVAAWLALAGRCLQLWVIDLLPWLRVTPGLLSEVRRLLPAEVQGLVTGLWEGRSDAGDVEQGSESDDVSFDDAEDLTYPSCDRNLLVGLIAYLQDSSTSAQQQSAAGYDVAAPLAALQAAAKLASWVMYVFNLALDDTDEACWEDERTRLQRGVLVMKLQQAGQLLNALPFGWGCNNPVCCNLGGASEKQPGKSQRCSGCKTLLQQGVPGGPLEAAQGSLQGTGS